MQQSVSRPSRLLRAKSHSPDSLNLSEWPQKQRWDTIDHPATPSPDAYRGCGFFKNETDEYRERLASLGESTVLFVARFYIKHKDELDKSDVIRAKLLVSIKADDDNKDKRQSTISEG